MQTSADAFCVINAVTGTVLCAKNESKKLPMASTTKIMTALLLCEYAKMDKWITVTKEMATVEGSSMGLLPGDKVTYHDLLYGMMLASGNDAANTTAISISGSVKKFVSLMNKKAKEIGLKSTHFETPSGLDSEHHYTTAYDLAILSAYALKNKSFAKAVKTEKTTLCYGNPPYNRTLKNHNKLLSYSSDYIGVKTGFTKKSGRCLVSAAERDNKRVITVTLHDPNDWSDHKALTEYGICRIKSKVPDVKIPESIAVIGAKTERVKLKSKISKIGLTDLEWQKVKYLIDLPGFVYAPCVTGEHIGNIKVLLDNKEILCAPVTVCENTECNSVQKREGIFAAFLSLLHYI